MSEDVEADIKGPPFNLSFYISPSLVSTSSIFIYSHFKTESNMSFAHDTTGKSFNKEAD
jgi:hypothetical protein